MGISSTYFNFLTTLVPFPNIQLKHSYVLVWAKSFNFTISSAVSLANSSWIFSNSWTVISLENYVISP